MNCPRCTTGRLVRESDRWGERLACICGHSVEMGATLTQQQAEAERRAGGPEKGAGTRKHVRGPSTRGQRI